MRTMPRVRIRSQALQVVEGLVLVISLALLCVRARAFSETTLFEKGQTSGGWIIGSDAHSMSAEDAEACTLPGDGEMFNLRHHESFYLQKQQGSNNVLSGKDLIMFQLQSCDPDILESLTFRAKFDGAFGRYLLPEIPMSKYVLNESQHNNTHEFSFLFPMSYLDSIWRNETFDRVIVKCNDEICDFALTLAAIIPAKSIVSFLSETLEIRGSDDDDQLLQQAPLAPGQPLFYWVCSIFPFLWCPPPAPAPPMPEPIIDPDEPEPDYDYDYGDGEDDYDEDDYEDYGTESLFLKNAHYETYARPGKYKHSMKSVTVYRTYGSGSFGARITYPQSDSGGKQFPIILFGHGLGGSSRNYLSKMRHFATHGFIVIAPESFSLFDGIDLLECLPWLDAENKNPSSFLFGAVDIGKVGIAGHSMGGAGSLAAASRVGSKGSIKCVAAIHPAPLVGLGAVEVPALITAGNNDVVTAPLPIKGAIYDSRVLQGPKLMANLLNAGHMEPVDGIGYQTWTPYLTAWFKAYLYSEVEASTLIWGITSPQSLQVNTQMKSVDSFPGFSVALKEPGLSVREVDEAYRSSDTFAFSGSITNRLARDTQYDLYYYCSEELNGVEIMPALTPILSEKQSMSFKISGSTNATDDFYFHVIGRDRYQNGSTLSSVSLLL